MPETNNDSDVVFNERDFAFPPEAVYNAFQQPELLAQWWGPNGFSNTFERFEFREGGHWDFVMHAPNGVNHKNENIFDDVQPNRKVVVRHVLPPEFTLTISLTPRDGGTHLEWAQRFTSAELAAKVRPMCSPANEEVLDRLQALLAGEA